MPTSSGGGSTPQMVFPVLFDLDKGVEKAGQDWEKTYAKKLEAFIARRPVKFKLDLEKLEDVKQRLAQLKIEPITPDTKASIKELARELTVLARALEQVQKYSVSRASASPDAVRAARIQEIETRRLTKARTEAQKAAANAALAEQRLANARLKDARAAQVAAQDTHKLNRAYHDQAGYLQRLTQRMAAYWSVRQVGNFLTSIREVTAQFELQRVSLGAILQDANKGEQIFSQIKTFALQSPVKILDLTKYTKQLAAYKIGYDELFDTMKRLTDVSVGLGVSMDRVVLAYGQTRATGYLRASEIRQFTEMGVPIVEELAVKLSKMNGELVTAADVMDLVSKRGISFELVKDVFNDMTSAGGIFYNMQEKQGNTLYGLWAKLGDAASVMYEQMGHTGPVDKAMKNTIRLLTTLMRNWEATALAITAMSSSALAGFGINKVVSKGGISGMADSYRIKMENLATAATERRTKAEERLQQAQLRGTMAEQQRAQAALLTAQADEKAALSASKRAGQMSNMRAAVAGVGSAMGSLATMAGWGVVIAVIGAWVYEIKRAYTEATRLKNTLKEIQSDTGILQSQGVRNFTRIADKALSAPTGSKEQMAALKELQNTYRDVFDEETLTIENLRRVSDAASDAAGKYGELTDALREYIAEQQRQKALDAIREEIQPKINEHMRKLREILEGEGYGMDDQTAFTLAFTDVANEAEWAAKSAEEQLREALRRAGIEGGQDLVDSLMKGPYWDRFVRWGNKHMATIFGGGGEALGLDPDKVNTSVFGYMLNWTADTEEHVNGLSKAFKDMNDVTETQNHIFDSMGGKLANYRKIIEGVQKGIESYEYTTKENTSERDNEYINQRVEQWAAGLQAAFAQEGIEINLSDYIYINDEGFKNVDWAAVDSFIKTLDSRLAVPLGNMSRLIQEQFSKFIPTGKFTQHFRDRMLRTADTLKVARDLMRNDLMRSGEDFEAYQKRLKETVEDIEKQIKLLKAVIGNEFSLKMSQALMSGDKQEYARLEREKKAMEEQQKAAEKRLKVLKAELGYANKINPEKSNGRKSDPRLQNLKEEISLYEKLYQEYTQYEKALGSSKAAEYMYKEAGTTIKALADKYGIGLPRTAAELTAALEILYGKMEQLPPKVFNTLDKELKDFRWKIEKVDIDDSQKNIENELKKLADKIARSKTAKEFYDKILGMTGDYQLASQVADSIFGQDGSALQKALADQVRGMTNGIKFPDGIISADNIINYKALREFADANKDELGKMYGQLVKISNDGQKDLAKTFEGYLKNIEKAKDYADKRIELARTTAAQILEIERQIAAGNTDKAAGEAIIKGLREAENRQAAALEYEQFKNSALYVQLFENLDSASKTALENMRNRLLALKDQWKNLSPQQVKELTDRLEELNKQIAQRSPFGSLASNMKKLWDMRRSGRTKDGDAQSAADAEAARKAAEQKMLTDEKNYELAVKQYGAQSGMAKAARLIADASAEAYRQAEKNADAAAQNASEWDKVAENTSNANARLDEYQERVNEALNVIRDIMETFGASAENMQFFDDVVGGLNQIFDAGQKGAGAYASFMVGDFFGAATKGVGAVSGLISGIGNLFSAGKVRRANKEIKRQGELLEQLEYTYGRLEDAADRLFGRDYLDNYNQQLENLQAQQTAYLKQAAAERSKGKKEDKEKTKEYENQARDTADKIKELQNDLVAHFTGSSKTDVARQMAKSWIEARASMSDSFAAIKGDYQEMIKNMIVEGAAARIIENALSPVWQSMEQMLGGGDVNGAINALISQMDSALSNANEGMEVLWQSLEAHGYNMKELISDADSKYSGIAKNVAGATSEEINNVAAIGNTLMYYVSPIPVMSENLAAIRAIMERNAGAGAAVASGSTSAATDYTAMLTTANQHLSSLPRMEQHLAEIHTMLGRVITTQGGRSGVNTFMR